MKTLYWDVPQSGGVIGVIGSDARLIPAGTTVNAMSIRDKNAAYDAYALRYDLQFIFEDNLPRIDFYAVPRVDIFALDRTGGLFGTVGETTDIESDAPVCYIDADRQCVIAAQSLAEFLALLAEGRNWREGTTPAQVRLFSSPKEAMQTLDFIGAKATLDLKDTQAD